MQLISKLPEIEVPRGWQTLEVRGNPMITMIVVAYNRPLQLQVLLNCFLVQTYQNFEIIVYHDGPNKEIEEIVKSYNDPRIKFFASETRFDDFGHSLRELGTTLAQGEYIGQTNDDNYYVPVYFEAMLHTLTCTPVNLVHCDMLHSHHKWDKIFHTLPIAGLIDAGGWIADADLVKDTKWDRKDFMADGHFVENMMKNGAKHGKVPGVLYIHN